MKGTYENANLFDKNGLIKKKWLKEPISKAMCRYLEGYCCYLNGLIDYNNEYEEMRENSDIGDILGSLKIVETTYGIIIEDFTPGYYNLYFYSFDGSKDITII